MYRILALCCFIGLTLSRQPDAPHHSSDQLPNTAFSCRDKVLGGYYADPDAQCQMFHVCVKVAGVGIQDYRFLCPNGTAFDQEAQICASWGDVACEPAALYYSSDNFDLYRIGSGFESKKAPKFSEEEQDFHLQRAEPDILSGAHSSNFFNNRESKNFDDSKPSVQNRNQVDQQQKRKVVKKLQRRPVETTTAYTTTTTTTTQRLFTNNFAGSYVPTTARPQISSTFVSTQAPQYNPTNDFQKTNYYEQTKQTYQPTYQQTKSTALPVEPKKIEQVNYNDDRAFRQRPSSVSDYSPNYESSTNNYNNNRQSNFNNNENTYDRNRQQNRRVQPNRQFTESNVANNYSSTTRIAQESGRNVNRGRGHQTYQNIRTTQRPSSVSETYKQQPEKQVAQYNNNQNTQNVQQAYNQQSTLTNNNNYRNENEPSTYKVKSSTQTTPQYSQQYDNNFKQFSQTYPENYESDKKVSAKVNEKKLQYAAQTKAPPSGFENYNKNQGAVSSQQTPAPKFNTNLLYDNNQQSTPDYYSSQSSQQFTNNKPQVKTQQYTSATSPPNYSQPQRKVSTYEQQPTIQPSTYNPGKNNYYNQPAYDKSKLQQQYSTAKPPQAVTHSQRYDPRSSTFSYKNSEYDDGQYRPEFYEREAGGEYDTASKQSDNSNYPKKAFPLKQDSQEQEFLKTAHSINIAASGNKLAKENQRVNSAPQPKPARQQYYESQNNQNRQNNVPSSTISSTKIQYYDSQNNQNRQNNVPSSTISSTKIQQHDNNQYQNYQTSSSTQAPAKSQFNYEDYQRNNNYYSQSSTSTPLKPQYDARHNSPSSPSSTAIPFNNQQYNVANNHNSQSSRQNSYDVTTQQPPKTQYTTASPRSVYSSFAAVTSEAPRPFSLRTDSPVAPQQPKKQVVSKTSVSSQAKPITSKKNKDVSYDYAYYDTSDHYSEYENVEEFGRTSKKH